MDLTIDLETAPTAARDSVTAFVDAVDGFDELALLGASRCHGWTRLDVVVHVIAGWQEMLGGFVSPVEQEPTVDAASYWPVFAEEETGDPLVTLMAQRRRSASYSRPSSACSQLRDVAEAVLRGTAGLAEGHYLWQGQVFTAGDFLAIWAVEDVIHHLDLLAGQPAPGSALDLAGDTVAALAGPLPADWTAEDAVLIGTGRRPVPDGAGPLAARLPALG
ncbi:maleylpyruvate isomerase N-terminal domain-containing protein [Nocardioides sp. CN2-186]|uniref:maleylpyruvate isomerase N-terminal domain-containing protein n=1 Tax=Nocardioides tweenelious TaxID=3156607 RepID=UPI0032B5402C